MAADEDESVPKKQMKVIVHKNYRESQAVTTTWYTVQGGDGSSQDDPWSIEEHCKGMWDNETRPLLKSTYEDRWAYIELTRKLMYIQCQMHILVLLLYVNTPS